MSLANLQYFWERLKAYIVFATQNKMEKDGSNYEGDTTLVSPQITSKWTIKTQDGTTKTTSTNNSIQLENGAVVDYEGIFKYSTAGAGQKNPTACSGTWGSALPAAGEELSYDRSEITTNSAFSETLYANKSGLIVVGSKVARASGNDTTSASASVSFYHKRYWGVSAGTDVDITTLSSELSNSRAKTITFDCSGGKYFYYAYPKALGVSSWNVGGLAFTGYTRSEKTITNEYGLQVTYYVYRSADIQTGSSIKAVIS